MVVPFVRLFVTFDAGWPRRSVPDSMDDFSSHLAHTLVPLTPHIALEDLTMAQQNITVGLRSTAPTATCPQCSYSSAQVRSRYARTLADLPWGAFSVRLHLRVRRFSCKTAACPRRIFTERLPSIAPPYARRTIRWPMPQAMLPSHSAAKPATG